MAVGVREAVGVTVAVIVEVAEGSAVEVGGGLWVAVSIGGIFATENDEQPAIRSIAKVESTTSEIVHLIFFILSPPS